MSVFVCSTTPGLITGATKADQVAFFRANPTAYDGTLYGGSADICDSMIAAVDAMVSTDSTHVLFWEADMRAHTGILRELMRRDEDIIAANYWQRHQRQFVSMRDGVAISSVDRTGIEAVDSTGCGMMLVKARVFQTLPLPWFSQPWVAQHRRHMAPDVFFCGLARHHGFRVVIDHDASQHVQHIGSVSYGIDRTSYVTSHLPVPDGAMPVESEAIIQP